MEGQTDTKHPTQRPAPPRAKLLPRNGRFDYTIVGGQRGLFDDAYHALLNAPWTSILVACAALYLVVNAGFAGLYMLGGDVVDGVDSTSFADNFWFSVQTLSTIGYGAMAPNTWWAHVLVTVESFLGLVGTALAAGLVFAKFSRPTARVLFSDVAVVSSFDGRPALQFRLANERPNQIVEARLHATVLMDTWTEEGTHMRRLVELPLLRSWSPFFALSWSAIHILDESSPLFGLSPTDIEQRVVMIGAVLAGVDETFSQTVHARKFYAAQDIRFGERFVDLLGSDPEGRLRMDLSRLHETTAVGSD